MAEKVPLSAARLRAWAVHWSITAIATDDLAAAIARLGFVQADPLRAPARAQDLILRHRVRGYRAGDLERRYPELGVEEDFLYAYGFVSAETRPLLHPRREPYGPHAPSGLAAEVLAFVRERGPTHPRDLEARFGRGRATNGWGGVSKATTHALGQLHYHGLLRVARRVDGIRVYEVAPPPAVTDPLPPAERLRRVALLIARVLAPAPQATLQAMVGHLAHATRGLEGRRGAVRDLLASGELEGDEAEDGVHYVWPAGMARSAGEDDGAARRVRFLAPFDPVVWDRRRFEHLWGWAYRFEAYTPAPKRRFGHYAMPLLWGEDVTGWVNCAVRGGRLDVAPSFVVGQPPPGSGFRAAFDVEVARMEHFLGISETGGASATGAASGAADDTPPTPGMVEGACQPGMPG